MGAMSQLMGSPTEGEPHKFTRPLPALLVAAPQAGHAAVHHHYGGGGAFGAQLRAFGKVRLRERVGLLGTCFALGALLVDEFLLVLIELRLAHETDGLQVLLDDVAELRNDRRHELPAGLPVAAAGIEYGLQLLNQEGDVATLPEHGRDDAGQRDDPLEMVEVLRI